MTIITFYPKEADIPEPLKEHYQLVDDKDLESGYTLSIDGKAEKNRVGEFRQRTLLTSNKNQELSAENQELKEQLGKYDPEQYEKAMKVLKEMESTEETKLIAEGKLDLVLENRTKALKHNYEEQISAKGTAYEKLAGQFNTLETAHQKMLIGTAVQKALSESKMKPRGTALEDIMNRVHGVFRMKEGKMTAHGDDGEQMFGTTGSPLTIAEHINSLAAKSGHLFESSGGGGADGSGNSKATFLNGLKQVSRFGKVDGVQDIIDGKATFKD